MKVDNITLAFWNKIILKEVSFDIHSWEFVFLIGSSGSWKTSLIRSLIGDFRPMYGDIVLDNGALLYKNFNEDVLLAYRRKIGVIFQDYKLLDSKSVYENVAFAMEVCWYKEEYIKRKVPETLKLVWLLIKKDNFVYELSGWEKQRVSIARALVHDPQVIIWDEPTGNLDPVTAAGIMEILLELNSQGKTIIIATHDKNVVDSLKKRVITFKDKTIISDEKEWVYNLDWSNT
jgi:cell division transport system ATP-binding protein